MAKAVTRGKENAGKGRGGEGKKPTNDIIFFPNEDGNEKNEQKEGHGTHPRRRKKNKRGKKGHRYLFITVRIRKKRIYKKVVK